MTPLTGRAGRQSAVFRPRQRLGKYRIVRRLAKGGFAEVFEAFDTIEGIHVALKIPLPRALGPGGLKDFRREVRLTTKELSRLGCELDPLAPTRVHIPGDDGHLEHAFTRIADDETVCTSPRGLAESRP